MASSQNMTRFSKIVGSLFFFFSYANYSVAEDIKDMIPIKPFNLEMFLANKKFPTNYSIYGVNLREKVGTTTTEGQGFFVTCDQAEVAIGAFCEEKSNDGGGTPNALLTAGVATTRSVACRWKNPGTYRVVASCMAIQAIQGNNKDGTYDINGNLD